MYSFYTTYLGTSYLIFHFMIKDKFVVTFFQSWSLCISFYTFIIIYLAVADFIYLRNLRELT